jgi:peptidoglycan/LPS O-acetylase OafA/YrhL
MRETSRAAGIDLCRGLAAFAVILVHSGDETWGVPISDRAIQFRHLFYFAVPFFLAASFYFSTKRTPLKINRAFWQKKFQRIVVPYLLWSLLYVVVKLAIAFLTKETAQIPQLLTDPVAVVFLGGASYHLYFIPLLIAGTTLLYLANYLSQVKYAVFLLSFLATVSILLYQLLIVSQNDFNLGDYNAFAQLFPVALGDSVFAQVWRCILVNLAWLIRCLPYLAIALLLHAILRKDQQWLYQPANVTAIFLFFLLVDILGAKYLPDALSELLIAYSLLLFGIAVSQYLPDSNLITNLGLCSFGIYLIHPVVKSIVEILLAKTLPQVTQSVSIISMLIYAISSFLLSWLAIALMQKNKLIAQYI